MSAVEERVIETDSKVGEASIKSVIIDIALLLLSAILFALSFPNFLSRWGWFPLAYISLFPVFVVVHRSGWYRIVVYGLLYGFLSYSLFNFWLLKFHPLAIIIVPVIYAIYFLLLFPLLKLADSLFPRYGYLIQAVIWVGYEYLKTRGFLGYSYGVIGYSQYLFLPLIRVSDLTGVWGISFLVIFPSCWLGNTIKKGRRQLNLFFKEHRTELFAYSALFLAAVIYGIVSTADLSGAKKWRVVLIQHNVDPWKHDYDESLDILIRLSEEAVKKYPHIVIWSETAFVPSIAFHTRYRANHQYYRLIERLKEFLGRQDVPYLIGNDDAELKRVGGVERIDYNAALLYMDGGFVQRYRKMHLVPFTEYFPYEDIFPGIYRWLKNADTHFWEKGEDPTVFEAGGVKFSTPICFEDTFGYISRKFVLNGAQVIINLTNDSWSKSVAAEMQHMAMSVLRAVENRRSVVRSTNGGITCTIDPNGKIEAMIDPFIQSYLVADVPVYEEETTLYTLWGDWFGITSVLLAVMALNAGLVYRITRRKKIPG